MSEFFAFMIPAGIGFVVGGMAAFFIVAIFEAIEESKNKESDMWKQGPLPKDTWNWGGVVLAGDKPSAGFQFADFCGDHVKLCPSGEIIPADKVGWYDNSIELPSGVATHRAGTV